MSFLKVIAINQKGVKAAIAEDRFDSKKHILWNDNPPKQVTAKKKKKPVDLDFEPDLSCLDVPESRHMKNDEMKGN